MTTVNIGRLKFYFLAVNCREPVCQLHKLADGTAAGCLTSDPPTDIVWRFIQSNVLKHTWRVLDTVGDLRDDEAQEIALRIHQKLDTFRGSSVGELRNWIRETSLNHCLNKRRSLKKYAERFVKETEYDMVDTNTTVDRMNRSILTRELLSGCSGEELLIAHSIAAGRTFEDIAGQLNTSKQRIHERWQGIVKKIRTASSK